MILDGDEDRLTALFDFYGYRVLSVDAINETSVLEISSAEQT